jgi:protein-tyrosine phosphatase
MKKSILFVCLGNICRSPSAEAVMKAFVEREGLLDNIYCDSAGIISNHEGNPADRRMQSHAKKRGFDLTSISRPVDKDLDFDRFDMIIGMDDQNIQDLNSLAPTDEHRSKIYRMTDFAKEFDYDVVPDPYYGGEAGFELVLDLLEDACGGLIEHVGGKEKM